MNDVVKRGRGRPPSTTMPFSQAIAVEICRRLAGGESLRSICSDDGFPVEHTVAKWSRLDPDFSAAYAHARELQAEHFADEIVDIADDGRNDFMRRATERGEEFVAVDREHLDRSKIRIATRQWVIERILSKKYGTQPQVVVNNQQVNVSADPVEAAQTYQRMIDSGQG